MAAVDTISKCNLISIKFLINQSGVSAMAKMVSCFPIFEKTLTDSALFSRYVFVKQAKVTF